MLRTSRFLGPLALVALLASCATLQQLAALRSVTFAYAGVSDVRIAGVRLTDGSHFTSLTAADATRLATAVISRNVPLEMIAHLDATNPQENSVSARMVELDWTLFLDDRQALAGGIHNAVEISPGRTSDVPLEVRLDLLSLGSGGARDLFDLALAIAGYGSLQKDLRLELIPTIDTSIGPIRYPSPVVVRRAAP